MTTQSYPRSIGRAVRTIALMVDRAGDRSSTATVLFTDLTGSTEIRRALGDDRADELRRRHDDAIRIAASEHQGDVVKGTGDGLMIVFPAAAQGVAGAVAIQRAIRRLERDRALEVPLAVRVGISAGDVAWTDDDCFGTAVVEAARLCEAAHGGQVVVSEVVRLLAGSRGGHVFEPLGPLELKGLGALPAYAVEWEPLDEMGGFPLPLSLANTESTLPLVGRINEREQLTTAWKHAREGAPHIVLVGGEPGVGKTRLVGEVARQAHADGAVVLFGRCDEEMGVPYQPFAEAISGFVSSVPDDSLADALGAAPSDLARLVPSLASRLRLDETLRADPETERYRLFEAVSSFLAVTAERAPVVFFIDDLHWAARPTLLLLRHLTRHRAGEPILIVATYRDTDLGRGHPLSEALADLRREPDVVRVQLRGLTEAEVVELVTNAAGHELDPSAVRLAQEVHAETEGNPFFIGQVLRHLVETGAVQDVDGRWMVSTNRTVGIPEGVREVIGKRLSQLAPSTNDVLSVAAVIGREFDRALLVAASGLDEDTVLDALEEAESSRLLVPLPGRDDRRTFAHALVRSTLYEEIPTTRRLRTHRRVADALAERAARGVACLDQLAHHSCEAAALGDVEGALRWSRAAAEESFERLAYEEAANWYQRAVDVLDPDDPSTLSQRALLRIEKGRALRASGAFEASRATSFAAADDARLAGEPELLAEAALVIAGDRGWSEAGAVDHELVALFEECLEALPPGDSRIRAMVLARMGAELYFLEAEGERRRSLTAAAVEMVEKLDDPVAKLTVLGCALWGSWLPDNSDGRRDKALEIVQLSRQTGNLLHEFTGTMWLAICDAELGDGTSFRAAIERAHEIAEQLRQPEWMWINAVHRATVALMDCRFTEADQLAEEALRIGSPLGSETVLQMYGVHQTALARARGGLEGLEPLLRAMVEQFPLIPAWRCGLVYLLRDLGKLDDARVVFESLAERDFADIPNDANWTIGIALISAVCTTLEDSDRAERLYEMLWPVRECTVVAGLPADVFGSVHGFLAMLAATMGRWDDAESHLAAALEADARMQNRASALLTTFEWSRLLIRRGRPEDLESARSLLNECRAAGVEHAMPFFVERCEAELARL